jgi:Beta-lactamase enzyme family
MQQAAGEGESRPGRGVMLAAAIVSLAASTTILLPACGVPMLRKSASRPAAASRHPVTRPRPRTAAPHQARPARSRSSSPDAALAAALGPVLRGHPGRLAAGIIDQTAGTTATYHATWHFQTASIVKADILAILLLQHQQAGTRLTPGQRRLATTMIEDSDNDAATSLWDTIEGGAGLTAGNAALGLHGTWPDMTGAWGLTTTTVADQLRLLTDLTSPRSPLNRASRTWELDLMSHVEPGQAWGVAAAAGPRTDPAVKNGWLPAGPDGQWVINSIGVVTSTRQRLLIAVLSDGQPTEDEGIHLVQAAARAAASTITRTRQP